MSLMRKYPPERFHVFISYTGREEEIKEIKPVLDYYLNKVLRPMIESVIGEPPVFYDGYTLHREHGHGLTRPQLREVLTDAIIESEIMLAFISPQYFKSRWCRLEWETMLKKKHRPWFDRDRKKDGILYRRFLSGNEIEQVPSPYNHIMNSIKRMFCARAENSGCELFPVIWKDVREDGKEDENIPVEPKFGPIESFDEEPIRYSSHLNHETTIQLPDWRSRFQYKPNPQEEGVPWHCSDWTKIVPAMSSWLRHLSDLEKWGSISSKDYSASLEAVNKEKHAMIETASDVAQVLRRRRLEYQRL